MLLKITLFIICFVLILIQSHCTTPQQRAEQVAFADACPKYGFFTEEEIKKLLPSSIDEASSFYLINDAYENSIGRSYIGVKDYRIAIKTSSGKIVHRNAVDLSLGLDVDNQAKHIALQKDLQEICGKDAQQFAKTEYEQVEESKRKVDAIKNSPTWKKALSQSAEFENRGAEDDQLLLAFLNSKDNNDVLNRIYYNKNPSEETEDRKIWKSIQKNKYIYIQKDNSEKNTYFFSKDYDVKSQKYPIYFEQGFSFGRSGMIQGDGLYIPRILSETIPVKLSPELATKIGNKEIVYILEVIFSYSLESSNHSYYYVNDNGLEIVLNEEKAKKDPRANIFTFGSKRTGKGKTIKLKPLYYIFSIPEEDILITNVR